MNNFIKKNLKRISIFILAIMVIGTTDVFASTRAVITLGKDLNQEQIDEMMRVLGGKEGDEILEVTNQEEREYLGHLVESSVLGSRAISSSIVEPASKGSGIVVETHNITWVTGDMVISALATAGVKDAKVKIAAPFDVSGTAALTGVIKGFEGATGEHISEEEKAIANEEIAKTGQLADAIGDKDKASEVMNKVKEEVVETKAKSPEEIRAIIDDVVQEVQITLTDEQKQQIQDLMEKISSLDLNVEDIKNQLKNVSDQLKDLIGNSEEVKGILNKISDFLRDIFFKIKEVFN